MNVKMTIEVSAEIAAKVAELLIDGSKPVNSEGTVTPGQTDTQSAPYKQNAVPHTVPVIASTQNTAPVYQTAPIAVPTQNAAPVQSAPTAAHTYTIDQLQTAIAPLLDAGKVAQIQQLVQSFGTNTLMDIPKERYGEFANGLRQLGGVL